MARRIDLLDVLDEAMGGPFIWGVADCCLGPSSVFYAIWGIDPLQPFRGTYGTQLGALRWIKRYGGLPSLMSQAGFASGLTPGIRSGAIGVLEVDGCEVGAINVKGPLWAAKADEGYVLIKATPLCSWCLPWGGVDDVDAGSGASWTSGRSLGRAG